MNAQNRTVQGLMISGIISKGSLMNAPRLSQRPKITVLKSSFNKIIAPHLFTGFNELKVRNSKFNNINSEIRPMSFDTVNLETISESDDMKMFSKFNGCIFCHINKHIDRMPIKNDGVIFSQCFFVDIGYHLDFANGNVTFKNCALESLNSQIDLSMAVLDTSTIDFVNYNIMTCDAGDSLTLSNCNITGVASISVMNYHNIEFNKCNFGGLSDYFAIVCEREMKINDIQFYKCSSTFNIEILPADGVQFEYQHVSSLTFYKCDAEHFFEFNEKIIFEHVYADMQMSKFASKIGGLNSAGDLSKMVKSYTVIDDENNFDLFKLDSIKSIDTFNYRIRRRREPQIMFARRE